MSKPASKPARPKSPVAKAETAAPEKEESPAPRFRPHRSFRRSYREDYARSLEVPGLVAHAFDTFQLIFKNWRLFLPLLLLVVVLNIFFVGLLSQETYLKIQDALNQTTESLSSGQLGNFARAGFLLVGTITTGGLSQGLSEAQEFFAILLFIVIWLVTIFIARQRLAGHALKLRDALYNACTPLVSSLMVAILLFLECIPAMLVIITYQAAVATEFLSTPFYALIYFIFAALMLLLSGYLVSNSFLALVAVSAPGLYPMAALTTSAELVSGRRLKLLVRLAYLIFVLALTWAVFMIPIILVTLWIQSWGIDWLNVLPIVPFFLLCTTVFSLIYFATYSYLFYRRLLDYEPA